MTPIGETLRRERLRRNLDFPEISRELKIAPHFLEAIEAERFERLPGAIFAKSFVRQYARLLGLDGDEMAAEVARVVEPPAEPQPAASSELPPLAGLRLPSMEAWQRIGEGRGGGWSSWVRSGAAIVLVTLACSAVYMLWERARTAPKQQQTAAVRTAPAPPPAQPQTAQTQPAEPQPAQPSVAQTEPAPPAGASGAPAVSQQQQPPSGQTGQAERAAPLEAQGAPPPSSGNLVHVQITAEEPVWVLARNNGKYLFSGTLDANQTRTVDAEGAVELRLGNAGGVEIQLNGKPIGVVGPKGQVRTVQLTSGGFTIVPPAKPASPPEPL